MAKTVTQFDLLISCPSDVKAELDIIKDTVENFNRMYGAANNASIVPKHWSTDSYPESGGHPQKLLNKQFVFDCDAAVAVFWTRFGTPTEEYGSGTEEEIEELVKSGKQVFLYFSDCAVNPSQIESDQYKKVIDFRNKYKDKSMYWTYTNIEEFKKIFLNHLSLYFVRILADKDTLNTVAASSKLSIKGVIKGKILDEARVYKRNYTNSNFIKDLRSSISELINEIQVFSIPNELVQPVDNLENEDNSVPIQDSINPELRKRFGEIALKLKDQMKGINSERNK